MLEENNEQTSASIPVQGSGPLPLLGLSVCRIWVLGFFVVLGPRVLFPVVSEGSGFDASSFLFFFAGAVSAWTVTAMALRAARCFPRLRNIVIPLIGTASMGFVLWANATCSMPVAVMAVVCGGVTHALLRLSWGQLYGAIPSERATWCASVSFIIAVVITMVLRILPSSVAFVVLFVLPTAGVALLAGATRSLGQLGIWPPISTAGRVPSRLLGPLAVSMFFFVLASSLLKVLCVSGIESEGLARWCNIIADGCAALLFAVMLLVFKGFGPLATYRCVLPLIVAGYVVLSVVPGDHRVLGAVFAAAGYGLFDLLSWVAMAKVSHDYRANPLRVFGVGIGCTTLGHAAAYALGGLFTGPGAAEILPLASVSLIVVAALVGVCALLLPEDMFGARGRTSSDGRLAELARVYALTPREADVLGLLARGRNAQAIARELGIARGTVQTHTKHVYAKMSVHNQQELIDLVDQAGHTLVN